MFLCFSTYSFISSGDIPSNGSSWFCNGACCSTNFSISCVGKYMRYQVCIGHSLYMLVITVQYMTKQSKAQEVLMRHFMKFHRHFMKFHPVKIHSRNYTLSSMHSPTPVETFPQMHPPCWQGNWHPGVPDVLALHVQPLAELVPVE